MVKSRFISFEGIDGAGKSTQIELLKQKLLSVGQKCSIYREPGGTPISEKIREILLDKNNLELSDDCESLLFLASRNQLLLDLIDYYKLQHHELKNMSSHLIIESLRV